MKKLTPPTVSIPDTMPGAGRRRYVRLDSHPGDPDPSGATQGIALQDPDLLDSIVKGYADQRRAETLSSAVSRHRDAALCPLAQTAGFRSDATSDRADRLYIVNRDEVMCRAETVRRLQRRSSDAVSVIVSMEPGQHRQLHRPLSCRRGTPYSSGPILRRCPPGFQHRKPIQSCAQADRCCFLLITQARAYKALRPRVSDRAVRVPPPAQFLWRKAATQRASGGLTLPTS